MRKNKKLYINTDVAIVITIAPPDPDDPEDEGLEMSDIVSLEITLTKADDPDISTTISGAGIVTGVDKYTANIPNTGGISVPGIYMIKGIFTDAAGKKGGLTPTPDFLTFHA